MKWISVEEKLPDSKLDDKPIVVLINKTPILCGVGTATFILTKNMVYFSLNSRLWIKDSYFGDVTHWMPVPPPPPDERKYRFVFDEDPLVYFEKHGKYIRPRKEYIDEVD